MARRLLTLLLLLAAAPATAQVPPPDEERQAVLVAVDGLFTAMLARDPAGVAAATEPEGRVTSVHSDGQGNTVVDTRSWAEFATALARAPAGIRERMFDPEVRIRDDLALVWARYDLHIGEDFSHCGTDLFELVRRQGQWRLLHASFTRQRTGCEQR